MSLLAPKTRAYFTKAETESKGYLQLKLREECQTLLPLKVKRFALKYYIREQKSPLTKNSLAYYKNVKIEQENTEIL